MNDYVMGYQIKPKTNIRCDQCKRMIGKDCQQKIAYEIREGTGKGIFCSGNCSNKAQNKDDYTQIDEMLDFEMQ